MAFPQSFIEDLIARNDIVDVVGSYVRLTKRSGANYFGLCPFHNERTPSFSVNPSEQFYYCFGCGKGGGVINFIMEIENLPYPDAVANLAQRAGMQMPEDSFDPNAKKRTRMLALNKDAARFFYEQLSSSGGTQAVNYMRERRISSSVATRFGLGYAQDSWDSLLKAMTAKGYQESELFDADLIRRRDRGGFYDTFRNRLMFPIIDVRGDVIGFSGRIIGDGEPKYLNSRDTLVYNKGRNLFALNLAKKSKSGYIILSEGNIDIVSLHQAGFDSAVASLGTSLTPEQARLLSRYTKQVIIAYDNDGAGTKAAQRAIGILERLDLKVKVLRMTGAKDPDEFIRMRGADAFRQLLEGSEDQIEYRLRVIGSKYDLTLDDQKVAFLQEATQLIASLPSAVAREVYASRIAAQADVGQEAVIAEVSRSRKKIMKRAIKTEQQIITRPERSIQPPSKDLRYRDPISAVAEEGVIRLLFREPSLISEPGLPDPEDFTSETLANIYRLLRREIEAGEIPGINNMAAELNTEEMNLLVSIMQKPELLSSSKTAMQDYTQRIQEQKERRTGEGMEDLNALRDRLRERKGYHQ